jgi:hypothetical protein
MSPEPRRWPAVRSLADAIAQATATAWGRANAFHFRRSLEQMRRGGDMAMLGTLHGEVIRADGSRDPLGLMSCRVVTTAGVNFLVDCLQGLAEPELLRFHGFGTGTTAEAVGQTALVTELSSQYATANQRPQGTLGEQAGTPNVFETVATNTVSAAVAVTEHGIFTQQAAPGGVLLDRSVFGAVNLATAESLQVTYRLTLPSGG